MRRIVFIIAFLDLVLNILVMRHKPGEAKAENARPTADYILAVQWPGPDLRDDDIDTYVLTPWGEICFFRRRDVGGLVVLERDDLGRKEDQSPWNREHVAFRELPDGVYWVSVHSYRGGAVTDEQVTFEIWDQSSSKGRVVAGGVVPMPPSRAEQQIGSFTVRDKRIVKWEPGGQQIVSRVLR